MKSNTSKVLIGILVIVILCTGCLAGAASISIGLTHICGFPDGYQPTGNTAYLTYEGEYVTYITYNPLTHMISVYDPGPIVFGQQTWLKASQQVLPADYMVSIETSDAQGNVLLVTEVTQCFGRMWYNIIFIHEGEQETNT